MTRNRRCFASDAFHDIAKRDPRRCVLIEASGKVAAVQAALRAALAERLGIELS